MQHFSATLLLALSLAACESKEPEPFDETLPESGFADPEPDTDTDTEGEGSSSTGG